MNTSYLIAITASLAVFSLISSVFSLLIHWKRPEQHPDVSRLEAAYESLRTSQLDLLERVETWMKRDSVRRARESRQETPHLESVPDTPQGRKAALRRRLNAGG